MVLGGVAIVVTSGAFDGIWLAFIGWFITQAARSTVMQTDATAAIEGLQVSDVMDAEPVTVPADSKLDRALDDFFLRYGWQWFPVVDHLGRFVGLLTRENVERVPEALRPQSSVDEVMARDPKGALKVRTDEPLETVLASEAIRAVGALMAVDDQDVLRGVVTLDQLRRALQPPAPAV
jgi:predicted transcriptional regulator